MARQPEVVEAVVIGRRSIHVSIGLKLQITKYQTLNFGIGATEPIGDDEDRTKAIRAVKDDLAGILWEDAFELLGIAHEEVDKARDKRGVTHE